MPAKPISLVCACALAAACGAARPGLPEVSTPDAGTPDAGSPDAGDADAGDGGAGAPDAGLVLLAGALVGGPGAAPGPIAGVRYTSAGASGFTDAQGAFEYPAGGAEVIFSVGGIVVGAASGSARLSPFALAGSCSSTPALTQLFVFLLSLSPPGALQLPHFADDPVLAGQQLSSLSRAQVAQAIARLAPGALPIPDQAALDAFLAQLDGEAWAQQGLDSFPAATGGVRSQGGASDGTSWFFSWQLGLQRTDAAYAEQAQNLTAIPAALALQGTDHIGDIDVAGGTLYAGLEDKGYKAPHLGRYDAQTLSFRDAFALDHRLQPDGVPWVAVDVARGLVYSSPWDPAPGINAFDPEHGMAFVRTVALSPALGRIQGAKVWRGFLYAVADQAVKTVYKINLDTGTALPVLTLDLGAVEQEGLIFRDLPDGTSMHTLNVAAGKTGMELRHHQRVTPPLRDSLCPP